MITVKIDGQEVEVIGKLELDIRKEAEKHKNGFRVGDRVRVKHCGIETLVYLQPGVDGQCGEVISLNKCGSGGTVEVKLDNKWTQIIDTRNLIHAPIHWLTKDEVKEAAEKGWEAALDCGVAKYREAARASISDLKERENERYFRAEYCSLCVRTKTKGGSLICSLCPVCKKTGAGECFGTPWRGAVQSIERGNEKIAQEKLLAEADFLESLRPIARQMDEAKAKQLRTPDGIWFTKIYDKKFGIAFNDKKQILWYFEGVYNVDPGYRVDFLQHLPLEPARREDLKPGDVAFATDRKNPTIDISDLDSYCVILDDVAHAQIEDEENVYVHRDDNKHWFRVKGES